MPATIEVPITIGTLVAALEARLPLPPEASPKEILALIEIFERVDHELDRLAAASPEPVTA